MEYKLGKQMWILRLWVGGYSHVHFRV